jgi:hypothetical protein
MARASCAAGSQLPVITAREDFGSSHIHVKSSVPFVLSEISPALARQFMVSQPTGRSSSLRGIEARAPQSRVRPLRYLSRNSGVRGARVYDSAGTDYPFVLMYRRTNAHLLGFNSPVVACRSYFDTSARAGWSVLRQIPRRYAGTSRSRCFLQVALPREGGAYFAQHERSWLVRGRSKFAVSSR